MKIQKSSNLMTVSLVSIDSKFDIIWIQIGLIIYTNSEYLSIDIGSSGGTSVESSNHFRNQFYPRAAKLNISDMTEQIPGQNNDDPESMFYKVQVPFKLLLIMNIEK